MGDEKISKALLRAILVKKSQIQLDQERERHEEELDAMRRQFKEELKKQSLEAEIDALRRENELMRRGFPVAPGASSSAVPTPPIAVPVPMPSVIASSLTPFVAKPVNTPSLSKVIDSFLASYPKTKKHEMFKSIKLYCRCC